MPVLSADYHRGASGCAGKGQSFHLRLCFWPKWPTSGSLLKGLQEACWQHFQRLVCNTAPTDRSLGQNVKVNMLHVGGAHFWPWCWDVFPWICSQLASDNYVVLQQPFFLPCKHNKHVAQTKMKWKSCLLKHDSDITGFSSSELLKTQY